MQLGLSVPIAGLTFVIAPTLPNQSSEAVAALQLYGLSLFPMSFYTVLSAALRGSERMGLFTIVNLVTALMQVGLVWLMVKPQSSIILLAQLLLGIQVLSSSFAGWLCYVKLPGFRDIWRFSYNAIAAILRNSGPIAFLGFLTILYQKLGLYLLATMDGAAATGLFSAAMRVVEAPKVFHVALLGALFPAMAQAHTQLIGKLETDSRGKAFSFSWGLLLAIAGIISVVLYQLSEPIISILFGRGFESSILALKILAWILIPFTVNIYLSLLFLAARKEKQIIFAISASLIILTILNIIWIPRWGVVGASWSALIAEFIQAGMYLILRKKINNASSNIFDEAGALGLEA
ncbi:MAG: oligosaccharide flippase family protein [Chloroflexi bacterium]|nr:oligosaccharide flippase family protein [Chloroflexota bacterium]